MRDSWIDEVHMSASWLCSLLLSHLLSLGSSDRSHNAICNTFMASKKIVLLSTACPTSLASEPNIRGGRSGVQTAPACGAAFGGIDNDQPEIKARQRHRARLDPKPRYPSKDFHHKEFAKKLRDGFRGLREKRKELNHNFKGNTEGNSYVPVDLYFKCSGRAALNFGPLSSRGVPVDCLTDT